ncbi:zinc finger CCCH domain-containing protein 5 [Abeliophyllum distichum]|uniref:Zinc finger CCCH domain-containing protein 5 n=1 Tax=Abeliophyllum distichum TaxID=126358 RepID=A0ABD1P9S0_9LAMI
MGESAITMMESEDAKSEPQKAYKVKHSNCGDNRKSDSYGRNYKYSDSDSDSDSDSSAGLLQSAKRFPKNLKKSKSKQDTNKNYDSESRVQYHEENKSHANVYHGEDVGNRGRWEPDEVASFKHETLGRKSHGKDHIKYSREAKLDDDNSDEYGNESKSPHSSRSSKRKHTRSLEARNFSKRSKESEENDMEYQKNPKNHDREISY